MPTSPTGANRFGQAVRLLQQAAANPTNAFKFKAQAAEHIALLPPIAYEQLAAHAGLDLAEVLALAKIGERQLEMVRK